MGIKTREAKIIGSELHAGVTPEKISEGIYFLRISPTELTGLPDKPNDDDATVSGRNGMKMTRIQICHGWSDRKRLVEEAHPVTVNDLIVNAPFLCLNSIYEQDQGLTLRTGESLRPEFVNVRLGCNGRVLAHIAGSVGGSGVGPAQQQGGGKQY